MESARVGALIGVFVMLPLLASVAEIEVDIVPEAPPPAVDVPPMSATVKRPPVPYASLAEAGPRNFVAETSDLLTFVNGDRLHGRLVDVVVEAQGLTWISGAVKQPIVFGLAAVSDVKLSARRVPEHVQHNAQIELSNDDVLTGDIVSMNDDALVLDTWYAGVMSIRRVMVRRFSPSLSTSPVVYEGPTSLDNWTFGALGNRGSWRLKNGALVGEEPLPIGRSIENMPSTVDIGFELGWRASPYVYISFFTDNLRQYSGNCYSLRISNGTAYLYRFEQSGSSQNMGSVSIQQFINDGSRRVRVDLLVDKKTRRFVLLLNGTVVKQWTETAIFAAKGNGLLFHPRNQGELSISNIRVAEWDGRVPQPGESVETAGTNDLVRFVNGDQVSGHLLAITDGQAKLETSYATMDIPLARIAEVEMAPDTRERARRNVGDVRAHFATKGVLTLDLVRLGENELEGRSENFGEITVPVGAFRFLEFNIYEDRDEDGSPL